MGVGKTTIGRQLARLCHLEFRDTDREIEQQTGADIPLIFDVEGEDGFRRREIEMIEKLTDCAGIVLATGGGAVLAEENRRALRSRGTVVYLRASIDTQLERTRRCKNRPLLQSDDPRAVLESLMQQRAPLYEAEADFCIDTDGRTAQAVAHEIARLLDEA
jgi:shikimate kinase